MCHLESERDEKKTNYNLNVEVAGIECFEFNPVGKTNSSFENSYTCFHGSN